MTKIEFTKLGSLFLILCASPRSYSRATESIKLPKESFCKITEDSALDLTPTQSLHTNGLFECAITCLRLHQCGCFNYQISMKGQGLCEVFQGYLSAKEIGSSVLATPGFVFVQKLLPEKSCLEYHRKGAKTSGLFKIFDEKSERIYDVYCDFETEPGMAWTLISSQRNPNQPLVMPFSVNNPIDEESPKWNAYRLSINRMEALKTSSTHWRVTCNFPVGRVDYIDYVRAKFSEVDIIHYHGAGLCRQVEYINIRGYNCTSCKVPWWQSIGAAHMFHSDSSHSMLCGTDLGVMSRITAVQSEDNFGFYQNKNKAFRCTKEPNSTTNWWFGGHA